jgi:predicted RNA binding protein YcfA (HicA-like mRNA interferase family)
MANKHREIRDLIRDAERRGWTSKLTGGGHYKLTHPSGAFVIMSATPRTNRAYAATLCRIRRIEREAAAK